MIGCEGSGRQQLQNAENDGVELLLVLVGYDFEDFPRCPEDQLLEPFRQDSLFCCLLLFGHDFQGQVDDFSLQWRGNRGL